MSSSNRIELKIGPKCEIFIKKSVREKLGFFPNVPIEVTVQDSTVIIKKKVIFTDLIKTTPIKYVLSKSDHEQLDKEINEALEN